MEGETKLKNREAGRHALYSVDINAHERGEKGKKTTKRERKEGQVVTSVDGVPRRHPTTRTFTQTPTENTTRLSSCRRSFRILRFLCSSQAWTASLKKKKGNYNMCCKVRRIVATIITHSPVRTLLADAVRQDLPVLGEVYPRQRAGAILAQRVGVQQHLRRAV